MPKRRRTPAESKILAEYKALRQRWRRDPAMYLRQRLGMGLTDQQRQAVEAIAQPGAKVSIRAGHGVGKTGLTAGTMWWFLECFDYAKIPCTAPTQPQLEQVLWAELAKWMRRSDDLWAQRGCPEALKLSALFELQSTAVRERGAPKEWFAVGRTARKEAPDALQGFHASDLVVINNQVIEHDGDSAPILFVIEEASGVPDAIFQVAEGALSSHGARLLMIGNPVRNIGFFADSHRKDRASYTALHFRCADSPLVDPTYRARLVRKYGEDSNVVRVRADGEFPKQDDDVLIALEWAEGCLGRADDRKGAAGPRRLGIDPARFGDDRTVYTLRHGHRVERIRIAAKLDTQRVAGLGKVLAGEWKADEIYVDEIGIGAGVVDRLREELNMPVIGVNVAAEAPPRTQGQEQPRRLRDHLWLEMRDWLRDESPVFAVPEAEQEAAQDLAGELSLPKYGFDGSGRLVVESKDDMKKRLTSAGNPGRSPDIADSLGVTFAPDSRHSTGALRVSF